MGERQGGESGFEAARYGEVLCSVSNCRFQDEAHALRPIAILGGVLPSRATRGWRPGQRDAIQATKRFWRASLIHSGKDGPQLIVASGAIGKREKPLEQNPPLFPEKSDIRKALAPRHRSQQHQHRGSLARGTSTLPGCRQSVISLKMKEEISTRRNDASHLSRQYPGSWWFLHRQAESVAADRFRGFRPCHAFLDVFFTRSPCTWHPCPPWARGLWCRDFGVHQQHAHHSVPPQRG